MGQMEGVSRQQPATQEPLQGERVRATGKCLDLEGFERAELSVDRREQVTWVGGQRERKVRVR